MNLRLWRSYHGFLRRPFLFVFLMSAAGALGQMSDEQFQALRARATKEKWPFTIQQNEATKRPLSELCGLVEPVGWQKNARYVQPRLLAGVTLPSSFDWRTQTNGLPPVRNQSSCGSCWAFATIGALECNIQIKDHVTMNLAEQWLVSCNRSGWGCDGGWVAYDYLQVGGLTDSYGGNGAPYDSEFPYTATDATCNGPYSHHYWIQDWAYIGGSYGVPSVDQMKQAILTYGPIWVAVAVDSAFQAYSSGIFIGSAAGINHAVVLVGWNDNGGTNGYWILRNSWGSYWGESGYMRIKYGSSLVGYAACYIDYRASNVSQISINPSSGFTTYGPVGGPFTPACQTYTLSNADTRVINWTIRKTANWITLSSTNGSLASGASTNVNVCVNANANSLSGDYVDTIVFSNTTSGAYQTRPVNLHAGQFENLALATRGSTITGSNGANWDKLIDGVTTGYTSTTGFGYTLCSPSAGTMTLDLKDLCTILSTKLLLWDLDSRYYRYKIEASSNSTTWTTIVDRTTGTWQSWQVISFSPAIQARYLRLTGTYNSIAGNNGFHVVEWEVYGTPLVTPAPAILTSTNAVTVPEGGTASFQVKLNTAPVSPTTVTVSRLSGDTDIAVQSGTSFVFSASTWSVYQTVTLSAAGDVDMVNSSAVIQCRAVGITNKDVTATEQDNTPALQILTSTNAVTVPEGGTASFQVKLNTAPVSPTTVTVSRLSGDTDIAVQSGTSLVFNVSTWSNNQIVMLSAAEDADTVTSSAVIRCRAVGITNKDVTVTEEDNDRVVVNLALASRGSTITGNNGANWSKLIDGVTTGYTGSTGYGYTYYRGSSNTPGAMTLDLKSLYPITRVKLLLWDLDSRYYRYKIEASSNNTTWTTIVDRTVKTNRCRSGQDISFDSAIQARYLRLVGTYNSANTMFHVVEWEVYGTVEAGGETATGGEAMTGTNSSSGESVAIPEPMDVRTSDPEPDTNGWKAVDGNLGTFWQGQADAGGWWLVLAYGKDVKAQDIQVQWGEGSATNLMLLGSADAEQWYDLAPLLKQGPVSFEYLWLVLPKGKIGIAPKVTEIRVAPVK